MTQEQRDNEQRQMAREARAAFIASIGYDVNVMARLNAGNELGESEVEKRDVTQVVFPRIDKVSHQNRLSLHDDKVIIAPPIARFKPDYREGKRETALTQAERKERIAHEKQYPFLDGHKAKRADDIGNDIILKRNEKTGRMMRKSNGTKVSRKPNGRATCEPLFCMGERDEDGFSRTIALRYLTKRLVFAPSGNAKGKEEPSATLRGRKTSSSKHQTAFYLASDIEDIIQEAFILFMTAHKETGEKKYATGNKLHDTCNACRDARNAFQRAQWAERKRLDVLAVRMGLYEIRQRSIENRFYDEELEQLLEATRIHGATNGKELAVALGISAGELSKRQTRLRERCERMERAGR